MKPITFKPVFGNENHIYIVDLIGKYNKMVKDYEVKKSQARGADKLKKDIVRMEERINGMIERENKK